MHLHTYPHPSPSPSPSPHLNPNPNNNTNPNPNPNAIQHLERKLATEKQQRNAAQGQRTHLAARLGSVRRHKDVLADQLQATRAAHAQDLRHFQDMEQALAVASTEYISLARRCGSEAEAEAEAEAPSRAMSSRGDGDGAGGEGGGGGGGGPSSRALADLGQAAAARAARAAAATEAVWQAEGGPLSPERGRAGGARSAEAAAEAGLSSPPEMARACVPRPAACG